MQHAKWIACNPACSSPIIVKKFTAEKAAQAEIEVCGLGFFELRLNGKKIGEDYFVPALTDYCARNLSILSYPIFDTLTHRALFLRYDLSPMLIEGENTLELQLGNGWFRQTERIAEGFLSFGDSLQAIFEITLREKAGTRLIFSDGSEQCRPSNILFNNLFVGEIQDYRIQEQPLEPVFIIDFDTALEPQVCPTDRVIRKITPQLVYEKGNKLIYDVGENITGIVRVRASLPEGEQLTLEYAEVLKDGSLDFYSTGKDYRMASGQLQIQHDEFISDGAERWYAPKFAYHAFRYFEVEREILEAEVLVIHAAVETTSAFRCSDETLNWLYDAYIRTQLNNMHGGVPSDCPHRERLGYTGDGQVCCEAAMLLLDCDDFYRKWIGDILDCQDVARGHIQHTAPFMGGGGGPGGWGCAVVVVPYRHYLQYGDKTVLQKALPHMKKWADYMMDRSDDFLVTREEEGGWCLGDWASLGKVEIPEPFVNTCLFIRSLMQMEEIAALLGEAPSYGGYIQSAKEALTKTYRQGNVFCGGLQGANAFAWQIFRDDSLIPELIRHYGQQPEFDTGFIGTDILPEVLFEAGEGELAFTLLTNRNPGSFYTMQAAGSTTIWEYFDQRASLNHPMFGAAARLLFQEILGIRQAPGTAGYTNLVISPQFIENLSFAEGKITTVQGQVQVCWHREAEGIHLIVEIPENTKATLRLDTDIVLQPGINEFLHL